MMLDVALKFRKAFETYAEHDHNFMFDLANVDVVEKEGEEVEQKGRGIGAPTESD
jgi:hypothetical protein